MTQIEVGGAVRQRGWAGGALNGWVAHPLSFQGAVCSGADLPHFSAHGIMTSPLAPRTGSYDVLRFVDAS